MRFTFVSYNTPDSGFDPITHTTLNPPPAVMQAHAVNTYCYVCVCVLVPFVGGVGVAGVSQGAPPHIILVDSSVQLLYVFLLLMCY